MRFGSGQTFGFARRGYGIIYSAASSNLRAQRGGPGTIKIGCHQERAGKGGQARWPGKDDYCSAKEGLGVIL